MRNLKKFLALVLAFMMAMSLMTTVSAKNVEFDDGESVNDAFIDDITVLAGMGVIKGVTEGEFQPLENVTRAEMAAIVYRLHTGDAADERADLYARDEDFTDVSEDKWYAGYVGYCANAQLIVGYGDGTFRPSAYVTGYEMLVMLLRAMGYTQPGEFSGSNWRVHAAELATQRHLLDKVNTTRYQGNLSDFAKRELVAEVAFQAAHPDHATVQWTDALGYQTTALNGILGAGAHENDSLGEKWYGLAQSPNRVVLGNKGTGESNTVLGATLTVANEVTYTSTTQISAKDVKYTVAKGYFFPDSVIVKGDALKKDGAAGTAGTDDITAGTGMKLAEETGLDLFAHEVEVWYNSKSANASGVFQTTYAILDRVNTDEKTGEKLDHVEFIKTKDDSKIKDIVGDASVMWSDRYSQIGWIEKGKVASADDNLSPVSSYRIIENPTGTVYVALSSEAAQVAQVNSTAKDSYIILGNSDSSKGNVSTFMNEDSAPGKILTKKIVNSDKALYQNPGAIVIANEIVGTSFDLSDVASAITGDDLAKVMYQLVKPQTETVTVTSFVKDDALTLDTSADKVVTKVNTNKGSYELSGITLGGVAAASTSEVISQVLPIATAGTQVNGLTTVLKTGVTYTAYLDEGGYFISLVPDYGYEFLYGTYADYEIGGLGTGTITYNMVGVNWNGEKKTVNEIETVTLNSTITTVNDLDGVITPIDGDIYGNLKVTMKDQGNSTLGTNGNELASGVYTGYMYNAGTKDLAAHSHPAMGNGDKWEISSSDATNGFKKVEAGSKQYLLTNETNFYVVSGTGSASLTVVPYKGLSGLLQGGTNAEISVTTAANEDAVIFRTETDKFGTVDTDDNGVVTDVILSKANLTVFSTQNLYFNYDQDSDTGMVLPGANSTVKQYALWNNGELGYYFIETDTAEGGKDDANTMMTFYTLAKIGEQNGEPIYRAEKASVTTGKGNLTGAGYASNSATYEYITVSNRHTGLFKDAVETDGVVFNLDNVTVVDVEYKVDPDTVKEDRAEITNVTELNNAVSVGKNDSGDLADRNYAISVAVVYDASNNSARYIYVTEVADN